MPFTTVPNVAHAEFLMTLDAQNIEINLDFERDGDLNIGDMDTLGEFLNDWMSDSLMPALSVTLAYRGVRLTDLSAALAPQIDYPVVPAVNGTNAGSPLPNNAAYCLQFKTAMRGRSYRGRNYIPGLTVTMTTDANTVDLSFADLLVAAYQPLLDPLALPSQFTWVIVSRVQDGVTLGVGVTTPVVAVTYSDLTIDAQRRRLPGRGS